MNISPQPAQAAGNQNARVQPTGAPVSGAAAAGATRSATSQRLESPQRSIRLENNSRNKSASAPAITPAETPAVEALAIEDQQLFQQLNRIATDADSADRFLKTAARVVCEHSNCLALWIIQPDEAGAFRKVHAITDENAKTVWEMIESPACQLIDHSVQNLQLSAVPLQMADRHQAVSAPIESAGEVQFVLAGCFSMETQAAVRQQWLIGILAQTFGAWMHQQNLESAETKNRSLNDALALIQVLNRTECLQSASMAIVNHLRKLVNAGQVALSFCDSGNAVQLVAVSDVESVDLASESNKLINQACNQAVIENETLIYPASSGEHSPALLPLEQYCKSNRLDGCINLPLANEEGKPVGSVLLAIDSERLRSEPFVEYLRKMTGMVAAHLDVVLRANRSLKEQAWSSFRKLKNKSWARKALVAVGLVGLLLCVPMPYRVACECEVQPVMRRYISAPYSGILESTQHQAGDVVDQGEVLATMDGRQLRIELSGLLAQLDGAKKQSDSALAKSDYAASQIAKTEMASLGAQIELLKEQLVNLEIRSPIGGIIVSGDLKKAEGAPLEQGQTLFEVGPLNEMYAEIAIPESEIQYVARDMPVKIKLNSFPFKSWTGTIERIHPGTELVNDETVFIARVKLPNAEQLLRPGLNGSAKIKSAWSPLGWNLFHNSWESVRCYLIW